MSSDTLRIAGGTFVRWGRKDCPGNDTELVYSGKLLSLPFFYVNTCRKRCACIYLSFLCKRIGFAGGSWYGHIGAAAEFVCLPPDPDLTTKYRTSFAYMYGAEYDSDDFNPRAANGDNLPCSVCMSTVDSSVLMIPGKSSCYDGWSLQYFGDLVAGGYSHKSATQYICLDEHSETLTGGHRNDEGKVFYPVKAVCGSLTCPPYHDNRYLSCVVCTK